jgi:hypothetical protein
MKCECKLCSHKWESRTDQPKACPKCKRYDWEKCKNDKKTIK